MVVGTLHLLDDLAGCSRYWDFVSIANIAKATIGGSEGSIFNTLPIALTVGDGCGSATPPRRPSNRASANFGLFSAMRTLQKRRNEALLMLQEC